MMSPTWLKPNMHPPDWRASYHRWPRPMPLARDDPPEEKMVQRILRNPSASAAAIARVSSATKVEAQTTGLPCYPRKSPARPAALTRVATWRTGPQHGVLKVVVKHAYGLEAADINGLSDPFVEVRCGGQRRKTEVIEKTLEPTYDAAFELRGQLDDFVETGLKLQVFDWDPVGSPDNLGEIHLPLHELWSTTHADHVMKLSVAGFIVFSVTWTRTGAAATPATPAAMGSAAPDRRCAGRRVARPA